MITVYVAGLESLDRNSIPSMMMTDESSKEFLPSNPKILATLGVPIIVFDYHVHDATEDPALSWYLDSTKFNHKLTCDNEEFLKLMGH